MIIVLKEGVNCLACSGITARVPRDGVAYSNNGRNYKHRHTQGKTSMQASVILDHYSEVTSGGSTPQTQRPSRSRQRPNLGGDLGSTSMGMNLAISKAIVDGYESGDLHGDR